jgi:hypothetical protein
MSCSNVQDLSLVCPDLRRFCHEDKTNIVWLDQWRLENRTPLETVKRMIGQ